MNERNQRLLWIARHITGVRVSYSGPTMPEAAVQPAEVASALRELVELREQKARALEPPRPSALRRWWGGRS